MKILFLAFTSKEYKSDPVCTGGHGVVSDRADLTRKLTCMETWVPRVEEHGHEVIFFQGGADKVEFDALHKTLHVTESDSYDYFYLKQENLPSLMLKKLQQAIKWALENRDFDYVLRIDDGSYVNAFKLPTIYEVLEGKDVVWSGAGGGGGIFFSRKACKKLVEYENTEHSIEDLAIFNSPVVQDEEIFSKAGTPLMIPSYIIGEELFTMHYTCGKRMYLADFIISNFHNGQKVPRKVVLGYPIDPYRPMKTNTIDCTSGENTPFWYSFDRDKFNWEYYGHYTRSNYTVINTGMPVMPFGKGSVEKFLMYNGYAEPELQRIQDYITHYYEALTDNGEATMFFTDEFTDSCEKIILALDKVNISYSREDIVPITNIIEAEYVNPETGTVIKFGKGLNTQVKKGKIDIVQYYTKNLTHGPYAEAINRKYCEEKGYTYYVDTRNDFIWKTLEGRAPTWYKPKLILEAFNKLNVEHILFLDTDAIIADFNQDIEQFVDGNYDFVAAEDVSEHSLMNAGVFLIKNSDWSKKFLEAWWDLGTNLTAAATTRITSSEEDKNQIGFFKDRLWMDQTVLTVMYEDYPEYGDRMKIVSNRSFNWNRYNDANFIFHAYSYNQVKNRTLDLIHNKIFNIESNINKESLVDLAQYYHTDKHYFHNYFEKVYQDLFHPIRLTTKKFVELGVHEGASMIIWREFFPNATIIGLDLTPGLNRIEDKTRMEFGQLNSQFRNELDDFASKHSDIDVFMDDGSHTMKDQQMTLASVFRSIRPGGIFVLEDLHTSLSVIDPDNPSSIWGKKGETTTLEVLENYKETGKIVSDFMTEEDCNYLEENIASVEIYNLGGKWSITSVIIKK